MNLAPTDPLVVQLTAAIKSGELSDLAQLLDEQPELARARIAGRRGGWRTPLHLATDWPGYFRAASMSYPHFVVSTISPRCDFNTSASSSSPRPPSP